MTDPSNPFYAADGPDAYRRVADLVMTLCVEDNKDRYHQQIAQLARDDGDPDFLALVVSVAVGLLNALLRRYPEQDRRKIAFTLIEMAGIPDPADLDQLLQQPDDEENR